MIVTVEEREADNGIEYVVIWPDREPYYCIGPKGAYLTIITHFALSKDTDEERDQVFDEIEVHWSVFTRKAIEFVAQLPATHRRRDRV